ncbi:hypothetical protein AAMO2058_001222200 [Amorphochlora amoebiformis]
MEDLDEFFKDLDSIFAEVKGISDTAKQDKKFDEANEILNDIQVEILSIPSKSEKAEAKKKYQDYKKRLQSIKRKALLEGGEKTTSNLSGLEKTKQGLNKLNGARDMLMGTEEVGQKILSDLVEQKETIKRSTATMKDTNSEIRKSHKLAKKMGRWWRA